MHYDVLAKQVCVLSFPVDPAVCLCGWWCGLGRLLLRPPELPLPRRQVSFISRHCVIKISVALHVTLAALTSFTMFEVIIWL
jgi:hypothetical protein